MKTNLIHWLIATLLTFYGHSALADHKPVIGLFSYFGEREITLTTNDALLLTVSIENAAARTISRSNERNQQMLDAYARTQEYQSLTPEALFELAEQYPINEIPRLTLGSGSISPAKLVNFQFRNKNGETIQLNARPTKSSEPRKAAVSLTSERPFEIHYVVESEQLAHLPEGRYSIAVALENSVYENMWNGWAYSNLVELNLYRQHPDVNWPSSEKRARRHGTYLLFEQQYRTAEDHARTWIERRPKTISGWVHLGDALAGQENFTAALEAFNTAETQFRLKHGDQPKELPDYIIDRIGALTGLAN